MTDEVPVYSSDGLAEALPASAYLDEKHHRREIEQIFFREWFCVGREEQISETGDFLHVSVAGERVLVIRDRDNSIGAFFNVCSHRGAELVATAPQPDPEGGRCGRFAGSALRCPYHAWTYELDGALRGAPFLEFTASRPRERYSLRRIPTARWGGFIWLNIAGADVAPHTSIEQHVATVAAKVERYPLQDLRIGRRIVYDVQANWKLLAENYNECYHCGPVHPELCQLVPAFKRAGGAGLDWIDGIPHRPGAWTFTRSGTSTRPPFEGLNDKERDHHKGEIVYPNLWISLAAEHVAAFTLYPRSVSETQVVCDFLFHRDEVVKAGFDPGDVVEFWDVINRQDWAVCESVQRGISSRGFRQGLFAPMEDASADIRRYTARLLKS